MDGGGVLVQGAGKGDARRPSRAHIFSRRDEPVSVWRAERQLHVVHRTDSADVHDAISPMHPRNTVTALRLPCLRLFDHAALLLNRGLLELQVVFLHAACGLSDILAVPRRRHTRQSRAASRETIDAC